MNTILVAIASMADKELIPTIKSALEKAESPELLTFALFVQDIKDPKKKIKQLIDKFGAKLRYEYVPLEEAKGVGYARHQTQTHLRPKVHKYFLQIDSHTMFIDKWDTTIIDLYEKSRDHWGKFVYSVYPNNYGYRDKKVFLDFTEMPATVRILQDIEGSNSRYSGTPRAHYKGNEYGELTHYFCGGFSFGDADILFNHPYRKEIFYNGEEPYMSIMLYADNIKVVSPPQDIVFHDCMGVMEGRRFSFFLEQEEPAYKKYKALFPHFEDMVLLSYGFLDEFYKGYIDGEFNEKVYNAYQEWSKFSIPYDEKWFKSDGPWIKD